MAAESPTDTVHSHGTHGVPDTSETISLFISLACISLMSLLFGRKTAGTRLRSINYARGLVVALYLISWLFSFIATMCVQTNNGNIVSCDLSIFVCIFLYAASKILIYLFLAERVYVVTAVGLTRRQSKMYRLNLALISPYLGILTLAIIYRVSELNSEGECWIGLRREAAGPLIVYDFLISSWLTLLFVRALKSSTSILQGPTKSKLRNVARRTLIGSICALIFSTANVASIVAEDGHQRGLACLALCTLDVTMNAIVIHWVTSRGGGSSRKSKEGGVGAPGGSANVDRNSRIPQGFAMTTTDRKVSPLESHISVTVESYVEQYHQLHYERSSVEY